MRDLPILTDAPIWVMEDGEPLPIATGAPGAAGVPPGLRSAWSDQDAMPALSIAVRLGLPFRRVHEAGAFSRLGRGRPPSLILCAGMRGAAQAMLQKKRHGGAVVHCLRGASALPARWLAAPFDLLVAPHPGGDAADVPGRVLHSLGPAQPVSPALLARARLFWRERLAYLPWPRLALVLGDGAPDPSAIAVLARQLTALVAARGGCILACVLPGCPDTAANAVSDGLAGGVHLLHRSGEPGPDPLLAFLGGAEAVVMAWTGPLALAQACAADGPVFVVSGVPARTRGLARLLLARDLLRVWRLDADTDPFAVWNRAPLDESGRIAGAIRRRYARLWNRSLEPDLPEQA